MDSIPEAVLRALRPRRALPQTVSAPARKPIEALRKKLTAGRFTYREAVARGVRSEHFSELEPLRVAAHALIEALSLERLRAAELEALAAFWCLARQLGHELPVVPALLEARGVADLLEVAALALELSVASPSNWTVEIYLQRGGGHRDGSSEYWLPVRNAVCAAAEPDYAAAKQRALALAANGDLWRRAHLAYAFPDETWGAQALGAWLAQERDIKWSDASFLLSCCRDPALVRAFAAKLTPFSLAQYAAELAVSLPEADVIALLADALPKLLTKPAYGPIMKTPPREVAAALTHFRSQRAAQCLAVYAGHPILSAIVAAYFQDHPSLAQALSAGTGGKAGQALAERVLTQVEAKPDEALLAPETSMPALLRERPWHKKSVKGRVLDGVALIAGLEERVELPAQALDLERGSARPMTDEEVAAYVAESKKPGYLNVDVQHAHRPGGGWEEVLVPAELALEVWNQGRGYLHCGAVALVARHGLAALPGFLSHERLSHLDYEGADDHLAAIFSFHSPRIAPLVARIAARRKKHRRAARAWLDAHSGVAVSGLIPAAVGPLGPERDDAEAALLFLAEAGHTAAVQAAGDRYGAEAARVIAELLARDPLSVRQAPPKQPGFLRAERLPALRLTSGKVLPASASAALLEMLSLSSLDTPYPGLARLQELEPASLGEFASALLEQWLLADGPGRHEWMLQAVVHFPSAESERRLSGLARDWARRDKAKAERACMALAALATDAAFMHLGHIAETSRFVELRKVVQSLLDEAAEARGLSRDELEDRTVPDLGLDAAGKLHVSFGKRRFVASLDAALVLVIKDEHGEVIRGLPRKTKEDDQKLAAQGLERLKALRSDAAAIAARQIRRLERVMVRRRSLPLADFQARVAAHPVLATIARALVWRVVASGRELSFRIAEDGSFADSNDEAVAFSEGGVTVAHPLDLGPELRTWASLLADYEIIQPFEQLAREPFTCPEAESAASSTARFAGLCVPTSKLLGTLEARDFERSSPSSVASYRRSVATRRGEAVAELMLTPGFEIVDLADGAQPQTLGELRLSTGATFGEVERIAYSELIRDIEALRQVQSS